MSGKLAYEETGAGPPIVFLHGITANRRHWGPVAERLAGHHRCLNVDLLGHGESPSSGSADLFSQVQALVALLDDLDVEAPVVVGHSYGGFIATLAATVRPVRGVVNVDQRFDTDAFRALLAPLEHRLRGDEFDAAMAEFIEAHRPDLVPVERQRLTRANLQPRQAVVLSVWGAILDTPPAELAAQVEAALPAVAAPYLAVFGSPISDEEQVLQALIPDGRVEVWDGLGHFVQLADPDRTAARIEEFVASLA